MPVIWIVNVMESMLHLVPTLQGWEGYIKVNPNRNPN